MEITEDKEFAAEILDRIAKREFSDRSGIHGTDLIFCLNKAVYRKLNGDEPTDREILTYSLGWASQRWLQGSFAPDQAIQVDGISVTPDVIIPEKGGRQSNFPWELKATYQSSTKDVGDNIHWIRQGMAEAKAIGSMHLKLTRLEIMGDWKWVFKPKGYKDWSDEEKEAFEAEHSRPTLHAWDIEFTQDEIDRFWDWMLVRKDQFESALATKDYYPKAVALASGQGWECEWCKFNDKGKCTLTTE